MLLTTTTNDPLPARNAGQVRQLSQAVAAAVRQTALPVIAVYLHGSWASAYQCEESDLDLAVLAERRLTFKEQMEFQRQLMSALQFDVEIDLADLYPANTVFAALVITCGERIYSVGTAADVFEIKTLAAYARLNEERQEILRSIVQRGTIYGQEAMLRA